MTKLTQMSILNSDDLAKFCKVDRSSVGRSFYQKKTAWYDSWAVVASKHPKMADILR